MWTILFASILTAAVPTVEARNVDGQLVIGPIVKLDKNGLTIRAADGPVELAIGTLAEISLADKPNEAAAQLGVQVKSIDGSSLLALGYSTQQGRARIRMPGGEILETPVGDVAAVRLQPQSAEVAGDWTRILDMNAQSDLLVVRKGDSIDYHRGVLREVTDSVVQFDVDGRVLSVKLAKVHGLVYYRSKGRRLPEPICRITDAAGSQWWAASVESDGERFRWTTPSGLKVSRPTAGVARLDFSRGNVIYLSDLSPESVDWTPYFGMSKAPPALAELYAPRQDRSFQPEMLQLDGKQYRKGLALHSRTRLVYRLPGRFRRFMATVGIDDRVRPLGHVRLVISGDDRVLMDSPITGTDPPKPLDLDLAGVRRLIILVDFGEDLDVSDHLDLCEARVVK